MDKMLFKSSHVAGYKQIIAHADSPHQGTNLYSIDTGLNGNILAGHYFDMNKDHLAGKLRKMIIGPQLQEITHKTLIIKKKEPTAGFNSDLWSILANINLL